MEAETCYRILLSRFAEKNKFLVNIISRLSFPTFNYELLINLTIIKLILMNKLAMNSLITYGFNVFSIFREAVL